MWMLQLQRVGVSRLRPRDQEGERNDRPSVCTRRSTHTHACQTQAPASFRAHSCIRARLSREKRRGESEPERQREERNLTESTFLSSCLPREHPKMRAVCGCY